MNKRTQQILTFTITGVSALLFLLGFRYVFGSDNLIVGIIFSLALVIIDLLDIRISPLKFGLASLAIGVGLGIVTYYAASNVWLAAIITAPVIFCSVYYLFGDFQAPLYFTVTAGYLYLLSSPEPFRDMSLRLLAIVCGAVLFTVALWFLNRVKRQKGADLLIDSLIHDVGIKAMALAGSAETELAAPTTEQILDLVSQINQQLYLRPAHNKEMSELLEMRVSLVITLERLAIAINALKHTREPLPLERQCLASLADLLFAIEETSLSLQGWREIEPRVTAFVARYRVMADEERAGMTDELFAIVSGFDVLSFQIETLRHLWASDDVDITPVSNMLWAREMADVVRPSNLRLNFATKMTFVITLLVVIGFLVPWPLFKWVGFTTLFVMRPYTEDDSTKILARIGGAIIGAIGFTLLFAYIENTALLLTILMTFEIVSFLLPLNSWPQTTTTNMATLGLVALSTHETGLSLGAERLAFVVLGIVIATFVTRFIFPYRVTIASIDLVERSRHLSYLLLGKILDTRLAYEDGEQYQQINSNAKHEIKGTILAINIIEHQLMLNNKIRRHICIEEFMHEQHELIGDSYFFFALYPQYPHVPKDERLTALMERLVHLVRLIDAELVRMEGRHTRYGGPEFYDMRMGHLQRLDELSDAVASAYAGTTDNDLKLALSTLGRIIDDMKMPFTCMWSPDTLDAAYAAEAISEQY